jgi:hypothetical protein
MHASRVPAPCFFRDSRARTRQCLPAATQLPKRSQAVKAHSTRCPREGGTTFTQIDGQASSQRSSPLKGRAPMAMAAASRVASPVACSSRQSSCARAAVGTPRRRCLLMELIMPHLPPRRGVSGHSRMRVLPSRPQCAAPSLPQKCTHAQYTASPGQPACSQLPARRLSTPGSGRPAPAPAPRGPRATRAAPGDQVGLHAGALQRAEGLQRPLRLPGLRRAPARSRADTPQASHCATARMRSACERATAGFTAPRQACIGDDRVCVCGSRARAAP